MNTDVVGHKTFWRNGRFEHEPLYADEAAKIHEQIKAADARRFEFMPDEKAAISLHFDAWVRLKELGWREACYCPKDGSVFEVLESGSPGIHDCMYMGDWPKGSYWIIGDNDMYPSTPVLFRLKPEAQKIYDELYTEEEVQKRERESCIKAGCEINMAVAMRGSMSMDDLEEIVDEALGK